MTKCPQCECAVPDKCPRCKRPLALAGKLFRANEELAELRIQVTLGAMPERLPNTTEWEYLLITEALKRTTNKVQAASLIGMPKTTFYSKLEQMEKRK